MRREPSPRRVRSGLTLGLGATLAWAFYNMGTSLGRADGFTSADLAALRYGIAALLLAPVLFWDRSFRQRLPLRRVGVLTMLIGPPFAFFINTGYGLAPLAHAVVISPGVTMLTANALTLILDRQAMPANRQVGMALLLLGLLAVATDEPGAAVGDHPVWLGDLCFVASGTLWGVFTWLIGRWRLPAVATTAAVSLAAAAIFLPVYFLFLGITQQQPIGLWMEQAVYQGLLGGSIAIVAFAGCVSRLGAGRAALFPALLPPTAVILSMPVMKETPSLLQWCGAALATIGLLVSLDVMRRRWWPPCGSRVRSTGGG